VIIRPYVGVSSLKKLPITLFVLLLLSLIMLGCSSTPSTGGSGSGIKYRAFISNSVNAGSGAGLYIVNAQTDVRAQVAPISAGNTPGMMAVTPNRNQTLVYSGNNLPSSDNSFNIINNSTEQNAVHVTLPGYTESFLISPDSSSAYVAVPTAPVVGQSPGKIEVVALGAGSFNGEADIPSVHYLALNHSGNRMLAFSDVLASLSAPCTDPTPSFVFLMTPSDIGVKPCPMIPLPGVNFAFDHPVNAFFSSDDTAAYVINCGAECGGTQASVQKIEMTPAQCLPDGVCAPVPIPAATVGLVDGETLYLAGTPYSGGQPSQPCTGQTTQATTCGLLTIFDLNSMTITNPSPIVITDGYHNRIALAANGQLFVGGRTCTEIIPPLPPPQGAEIRGCLSVYNTQNKTVGTVQPFGVWIPSANGDVTGLQPIATRTVVYVVQGSTVTVYDAAKDALAIISNNPGDPGHFPNLVGNFVDVKTVDF
jgi:hypothetical protein